MTENPYTSIGIDTEIKDDDSKIASSKTVSLKSSVVTTQKKDKPVLPSGHTTPLQKNPNPKKPKKSSNKEDITKNNKVTQDFESEIQQAKTHKQKDNTDENNSTEENESSKSDNRNDS